MVEAPRPREPQRPLPLRSYRFHRKL